MGRDGIQSRSMGWGFEIRGECLNYWEEDAEDLPEMPVCCHADARESFCERVVVMIVMMMVVVVLMVVMILISIRSPRSLSTTIIKCEHDTT